MSFDFKKLVHKEVNVGLKEQKIRYAAGAGAAVLSIFLGNVPLLLLAAILLATGKLRWCPLYSGLGKSTVDPNEAAQPAPPPAHGGDH